MEDPAVIDDALTPLGRMNFTQDCAVSGAAARIVMNEREIFLAVADAECTLHRATFGDTALIGDGARRSLRFDATTVEVDFDSDDAARRTSRVLGVRQDAGTRPLIAAPAQAVRPASVGVKLARNSALEQYRRWSDYTLLASTAVLIFGWIELAFGVIAALVAVKDGNKGYGFALLFGAAAAWALLVCVGSAARLLVYRSRVRDEAR